MTSNHTRLIKKLSSVSNLTPGDVEALRRLPLIVREINGKTDIVNVGDCPTHCCLLLDGMLYTSVIQTDGTRQITSLHMPGDIPDLQGLHIDVMNHNVGAICASMVAFIPHAAIYELIEKSSNIASTLWRETLIGAAIYREWLVNVGARTAYQRTAHLLCEVSYKMRAVGLSDGAYYHFPLTQDDLADALGLSSVHVNRTVQQLRADGLIVLQNKLLKISDWAALKNAGGFDPSYLHFTHRAVNDISQVEEFAAERPESRPASE